MIVDMAQMRQKFTVENALDSNLPMLLETDSPSIQEIDRIVCKIQTVFLKKNPSHKFFRLNLTFSGWQTEWQTGSFYTLDRWHRRELVNWKFRSHDQLRKLTLSAHQDEWHWLTELHHVTFITFKVPGIYTLKLAEKKKINIPHYSDRHCRFCAARYHLQSYRQFCCTNSAGFQIEPSQMYFFSK